MKIRSARGVWRHRIPWIPALLLTGAVCAILLPLIWTLLASFGMIPDITARPPSWTWPPTLEHYNEVVVLVPGFASEFEHSLVLSGAATLLTILVALPAAYGLVRSRFRGKQHLIQSFLVLATLPVIAYIIPLSDIARRLHLQDTFAGLTLADAAVYAPLAVYVLSGYVAGVSLELEEAAWLEGASIPQILQHVVIPLTAPGLAAVAVLVFVLNWNMLLVPLVLSLNLKTVPIAVIDFFTFERELEWPTAAAALMVSLVPVLALVSIAHRALERFALSAADTSSA